MMRTLSLLQIWLILRRYGAGALTWKKRYVIGVDIGTESARAAVIDCVDGRVISEAVEALRTSYPAPGRVEQDPNHWYEALGLITKRALQLSKISAESITALCLATTSCTVVACSQDDGKPVRPALMWCDARATHEAAMTTATDDSALRIGNGAVSAEFFIPKALWLKRNEAEKTWQCATRLCECQDWLNFKLTNKWVANSCNIATRWHGDGRYAAHIGENVSEWRPLSLLRALDLEDLVEKWPQDCVAPGRRVGMLTVDASRHLGLASDTVLVQGAADAFLALVGCGAGADGGAALITGSSHLQLACVPTEDIHRAASKVKNKPIWGPYTGAPLSFLTMAEAGQSSTGSVLRFASEVLFASHESMADLDDQAARLPPGSNGLRASVTFQGSRTPVCNPSVRGSLYEVSLAHTRPHIWRALIEAIALGTRDNMRNLLHWLSQDQNTDSGLPVCGGATKSKFFLQTHANFLNRSVLVKDSATLAPVLGAGALATACLDFKEDAANAKVFDERHRKALRRVTHKWHLSPLALENAAVVIPQTKVVSQLAKLFPSRYSSENSYHVQVSASLLAADPGSLVADAEAAHLAGAWLHVDVCDGSPFSRYALSSLGPASVTALRRALPDAHLDVHLAARDPYRHFAALAAAGASRVTVQLEAIDDIDRLAHAAQQAFVLYGCNLGLALAPQTPIDSIQRFLDAGLDVELIDIMAVEPGRGGQLFQEHVLDKLTVLATRFPQIPFRQLDGGLNATNARAAVLAGANVLAVGSAIFFHEPGASSTLAYSSGDSIRPVAIAEGVALLQESGGAPLDYSSFTSSSAEKKKKKK